MRLFTLLFAFLLGSRLYAQYPHPSEYTTYQTLRADSLVSLSYSPSISYPDQPGLSLLDLSMGMSYNSKYPRSYNDGPLWQGKGLTTQVNSGFQLRHKLLHITANPILYYSQNIEYALGNIRTDRPELGYQFGVTGNIDYVQRYGTDLFLKFHPGQSEIALRNKRIEVSVSTQNFILGPARYQSIVMSNGGSGFPYLNIGTNGAQQLTFKKYDLGKLDARIIYGLLSESDYFDTLKSNDYRFLDGYSIGYQIPKVKTITVGVHRIFYKNLDHFEPNDLYSFIKNNESALALNISPDDSLAPNDAFDQMAGVFLDWKMQDNTFRFFFEIVKNDFNGSFKNFLQEFEHATGHSIGMEKIYTLTNGDLHLYFEQTNLIRTSSYRHRPGQSFYSHEWGIQGYTQDGQLIGAGIGPGSASEIITVNYHHSKGYFGFNVQRIRFNEDYFNLLPIVPLKQVLHDVEYSFGLNYSKQYERFILSLRSTGSYRFSMYNLKSNDKINLWGNVTVQVPLQK